MLFLNGLKHNNVILGPSVIKGVAVLSQYVTKRNGKDVGLSYYHNLWRASRLSYSGQNIQQINRRHSKNVTRKKV